MKSLFSEGQKSIVITDSERDIKLLRDFANSILGREVHFVEDIAGFWSMHESSSGIFILDTRILEASGNLEHLRRLSLFEVTRSTEKSPESIIEKLIEFGYTHSNYTGELGTYKREGSTLSLTDSLSGNLYHIEWFDTEIDNIIEIDAKNGNRHFREYITIKNKHPKKLERKEGEVNQELLKLVDFNLQNIIIGCNFLPYIEELRSIATMHFSEFQREDSISLDVSIPDIPHIDVLKEYLLENRGKGVTIYTKYEKTLRDFLEYNSLSDIPIIPVNKLGLESFEFGDTPHVSIITRNEAIQKDEKQEARFLPAQEGQEPTNLATSNSSLATIVITDDILGEIFVQNRTKKSIAKNLDLLLSLKPGDYVVHREHGIAKFYAVVKKKVGEIEREYLELHYLGDDKLFVPLTEIYRVSKYLGNLEPELTNLAGKEWERTIEKADEEIEAIAHDILETSAKRSLAKGRSFGKFREEEKKFQEAFAYEYTKDQSSAIQDIFEDMEAPTPMDRLISGDVGFGKTEVAMNAIYKAVLSGTQVAVISPLLVLADEHYETFTERLGAFGVRVGVMTRMSSERDQRKTLEDLKNGTIDVVVGTHRLLSDDIRFARLGLLVIDEEHKFGVSHKEKLKKMRSGLDILSLSATPIPRSLNLALSGLKKISILATAPKKKKPIETIITKWNESVIAKAISYEIERGGQIIIVHNRIRGMESIEKEIKEIIKNSKGKMKDWGKDVSEAPLPRNMQKGVVSESPPSKGGQGGNRWYAHSNKAIPYNRELLTFAKENRKTGNPVENHFWYDILKSEQLSSYKFTRQKPLLDYIVDFYCSELGVIVELDGDSHTGNIQYDEQRTEEFEKYGLKVIRFTNQDVMQRTEGIIEMLVAFCRERKEEITPLPPLKGGPQEKAITLNFSKEEHPDDISFKLHPSIIITHGQMPPEQIEDRIHAFKKHEYDILLTTTIIENGVNFLSANTIIIIDPEDFGLAQLHQLRGRVGRKDTQGYCYLIYRKPELVKEEKERLITIANNTHLGAGFEIAMRDLEIRGAGDVLGFKQSGKSKDVGLTLYFRMLEEKIEELKNERKKRTWTKIELDISYLIPDEYFLSETDKLNFYREIENIETIEELEEMERDFPVASCQLPEGSQDSSVTPSSNYQVSSSNSFLATNNLFLLLRARLLLSEYQVMKLSKVGMNYVFDFAEGVDVVRIKSFLERFDTKKRMVLVSLKKIRVETRYWRNVEEFLNEIII